jgi:hypothetical protein
MAHPIRRNVATLTPAERAPLRDAILQLDTTLLYPDGVSYWDKQDAIHQATHNHGGPSFLPWHRELCNRFEKLLQEVDPSLALHYWDWTTDPRDPNGDGDTSDSLFTADFMGSASGNAGAPFAAFGITRDVNGGTPGAPGIASDATVTTAGDGLPNADQFAAMRGAVEGAHNSVHGYIGGTIGNGHTAFEDPFVFLLHSNVDRLFAMWQTMPGREWRLDPNQVYGAEDGTTGTNGIQTAMEPWAGGSGLRPWAPPENEIEVKNAKHPSIVAPPCYDTLPLSITLTAPAMGMPLRFLDVPEGETTYRAVVLTVTGCRDLTFEIVAGPGASFDTPLGTSFAHAPASFITAPVHVWIAYTGTTAGDTAGGSVTVRCTETGDEWTIPITANTIARPTVASMLVLDRSGSMDWASGIPGNSRLAVLKAAAPIFVDVMPDNDALGILSFDHDPHPVMSVTTAGAPVFGAGRANAKAAIVAHATNPAGATAIGDGVELAHNTLLPVAGFDHKAIVVFTDGHETASKYISDIVGLIDERVYAIGLGTAEQLNPVALNELTDSSGGFLLMTGNLGPNDLFRLAKYYLQILAGVTNTNIVVDPESSLLPGQLHRIPFDLAETDFGSDVILLSPAPWAFAFMLETPDGTIIDSTMASGIPGMRYVAADQTHYYRMTLPLADKAREGRWHALLKLDEGNFKEYLTTLRRKQDERQLARAIAHGIPYSLSVHARSNLRLQADVVQGSHVPGATVTLRAQLSEYGVPVARRGAVIVEVQLPDRTAAHIPLSEVADGVFEGSMLATLPGVYQLLFRASGVTLRGLPFTREELRTAGVWRAGDGTPPSSQTDPRTRDEQLCHLLECLTDKGTMGAFFERHGIDGESLRRCIARFCEERLILPAEVQAGRGQRSLASQSALEALLAEPEGRTLVDLLSEALRRSRG